MIVHYLASNPNFLPFFFIGFTIALGWSFWGSAKQGCLIGAVYIYVFGAWVLTCSIFILSQPSGQEFFVFGFLAYHFKTVFSWLSSAFFWVLDQYREQQERKNREQWQKEQAQNFHQYQQNSNQQQERARAEQARREQEARQYREQQERARREQEQQRQRSQSQQQNQQRQEQRREASRDPLPPDNRNDEQILGLQAGWTQDDLKTAYRREAQRTHPDKWTGKPANIQAIMEAEYKAVQNAYNRLKR